MGIYFATRLKVYESATLLYTRNAFRVMSLFIFITRWHPLPGTPSLMLRFRCFCHPQGSSKSPRGFLTAPGPSPLALSRVYPTLSQSRAPTLFSRQAPPGGGPASPGTSLSPSLFHISATNGIGAHQCHFIGQPVRIQSQCFFWKQRD